MNRNTICLILCAGLAGCATSSPPKAVASASERERAVTLDQVKKLAGTWENLDNDGKVEGTTVFSVSSAGSAVREVMFPGETHEMTNVYHMDGQSIVMTHYCAEGNQPRMRAKVSDARPGQIAFKFDTVTNLTRPNQEYMGQMTLTIKDDDHIVQDWTSFVEGKSKGITTFNLRRRK